MSQYEALLIAYGMDPEEARFHAWDQERQHFANREHEAYGRAAEDEA